MSDWFERWFGEEYLALYRHRDEAEARHVVELLARLHVLRPGSRVLDLACGAGRHLSALREAGARVVGLDLSATLLREARRAVAAPLVRADMRAVPLRDGCCDAVVNLFTSFGYFDEDAAHQQVLDEVARVLAPGGRLALDFLNATDVRRRLVARDSREVSGQRVVQERRLSEDGAYVEKTIRLGGEGRSFLERVRLFERAELEAMLVRAGLRVEHALGDYDGGPHEPVSPRLLLVARR